MVSFSGSSILGVGICVGICVGSGFSGWIGASVFGVISCGGSMGSSGVGMLGVVDWGGVCGVVVVSSVGCSVVFGSWGFSSFGVNDSVSADVSCGVSGGLEFSVCWVGGSGPFAISVSGSFAISIVCVLGCLRRSLMFSNKALAWLALSKTNRWVESFQSMFSSLLSKEMFWTSLSGISFASSFFLENRPPASTYRRNLPSLISSMPLPKFLR